MESTTVTAAVFQGPERGVELQQFPVPSLKSREALVDITCCTVCGSDLHTLRGDRNEPTPSILGHEAVGRVVAVGPQAPYDIDANEIKVGDRVVWSPCVSCGFCDRCLAGWPQKCESLFKYGHEIADGRHALSGGLSESILLRPGSAIARVPDAIPDVTIAPSSCATATVMAAIRSSGFSDPGRVLILGAGMLGLTAAAILSTDYGADVVVADTNVDRLRTAMKFGCNQVIPWEQLSSEASQTNANAPGDYQLILEMSGSPQAVSITPSLADIGGSIVLVGSVLPSPAAEFSPETIVRKCLRIHGMHNYAPADLSAAVDFLARTYDQFPWTELIASSHSLTDAPSALASATIEKPIRIAIVPTTNA